MRYSTYAISLDYGQLILNIYRDDTTTRATSAEDYEYQSRIEMGSSRSRGS